MTKTTTRTPDPAPEERRVEAPMMSRAAEVRPSSYREEDNSIELVWTTGAQVRRFDWLDWEYYDEELVVEESAIRLGRLNSGAPLLDTHASYRLANVIGSVEPGSVRVEDGMGIARVRLAETPDCADTVAKVIAGHIRNVSVGYIVHSFTRIEEDGKRPLMRADDWEPVELSLVPVPADPDAQIRARSAEQGGHPCIIRGLPAAHSTENVMNDQTETPAVTEETAENEARSAPTPPAPTPPRSEAEHPQQEQRIGVDTRRIRDLCERSGQPAEFTLELIARNDEEAMTEAELSDAIAERIAGNRTTEPISARVGASGVEGAGYREAIEGALIARANPRADVPDGAREFRGMSLLEMARDFVERSGRRARGLSRLELAGEALGLRSGGMLTTSDFAVALANSVTKILRDAYEAAPATWRPFVDVTTLPDFKAASIVSLSEAPDLLPVNEHGEFTRGTLEDKGASIQLETFGRIVAITRQAIVNDDLGVFTRLPRQFGRAAADLEADTVYALLTSNPTLGDGVALFHANHGNLGSAAAISVTSLGAARAAMRKQTGIEGRHINVEPKYLIVGPDKETEAQQVVAAITAAETSKVNPFQGTLTPIADARITGNQWFLAADPAQVDTIALAHLEGQEGVFTDTRVGWDVDGVETKARLDVAAAVVDYRGLFKNPGA